MSQKFVYCTSTLTIDAYNDVWKYSITNNAWTYLTNITNAISVFGHTMVVRGDHLYLFGGVIIEGGYSYSKKFI